MSRGDPVPGAMASIKHEIEALMRDYAKNGGTVAKLDEGKITVDWSKGGFREIAKTVGKLGHKKRRKKT